MTIEKLSSISEAKMAAFGCRNTRLPIPLSAYLKPASGLFLVEAELFEDIEKSKEVLARVKKWPEMKSVSLDEAGDIDEPVTIYYADNVVCVSTLVSYVLLVSTKKALTALIE